MTPTDPLWYDLFDVAAAAFVLTCAIKGMADFLDAVLVRIEKRRARIDAQTAADFGEPSRAEVEAGWLNEDDETWNSILDTLGLTEAEVRRGYEAARQAERMDRIREQIRANRTVSAFRDELAEVNDPGDWPGGAA